MRIRMAVIAICLLAIVPTFGATDSDFRDCSMRHGDRSIDACTRIIDDVSAKESDHGGAHFYRAQGDYDRAQADFDKGVSLEDRDAVFPLGQSAFASGDYTLAILYLDASIRIEPKQTQTYYMRGLAHLYEYSASIASIQKGGLD